uniref:Uncharacterized protein n=1 Tax=Triticum urartu TaxID=4572 RepID=A0A8R7TT64_TRIUA
MELQELGTVQALPVIEQQRAAIVLRGHHPVREGAAVGVPVGGEHEPVPPGRVDAEAAVVREALERQRDVLPGVLVEPEPRAGEHRVAGVVEALPQDQGGVPLVPHHQVAVVEEDSYGGGRHIAARRRHAPEAGSILLDAETVGEDLQRRGGQVGDDDPVPEPEGRAVAHIPEPDPQEVVDAGARRKEAQLEAAALGDQGLVPGDALAREDGVRGGRRGKQGTVNEQEEEKYQRRPFGRGEAERTRRAAATGVHNFQRNGRGTSPNPPARPVVTVNARHRRHWRR